MQDPVTATSRRACPTPLDVSGHSVQAGCLAGWLRLGLRLGAVLVAAFGLAAWQLFPTGLSLWPLGLSFLGLFVVSFALALWRTRAPSRASLTPLSSLGGPQGGAAPAPAVIATAAVQAADLTVQGVSAGTEAATGTQGDFPSVAAPAPEDGQLRRAKEDAEAASLAKSRFMTGLSHELRTPLNSILGYAQILQRDTSLPPKRRAAVDVIHRNGRYLVGLIDGMLDISRIEAGKLRLDNAPLRLPEFLAQMVSMFSLQAAEKGLAFDYSPAPNLPDVVNVDEKRLGQILINLLSNAVKYTTEGSVQLRLRYVSQVAHFEVSDTGAGIPEADLERVFQPFERSWAGERQADTGTGLGLTICSLLSHLMGGDLAVQSQVGKGSVFTLRLFLPPAHATAQARPPLQNSVPVVGYLGPRRRVLVVDDQPQQRRVLDDMLAPLGFEVTQACDGPDCLQAMATLAPDIVLMDMSMPGMTGLEVCARAREQGFRQPVVLVSADLTSMTGDDPDAGISYVPKPVLLELLLAKIRGMLDLEWVHADAPTPRKSAGAAVAGTLSSQDTQTLLELAAIGYVKGIQDHLRQLREQQPEQDALIEQLELLLEDFRLEAFVNLLRESQRGAAEPSAHPEIAS